MTTMVMPQRFTIHLPNQGVAKLTPVPPSFPPPPHLLARPKATAKASGCGGSDEGDASNFGAKRGAGGEEGKGAAVKDTSKEGTVNLTEYFARYELTRIRREWHDQFEAIAQAVVDICKCCTKLPEEWHHELKSIAKSLVDVFVIMVHVGEEMGSVIQCYTNVIQMLY